MLKDLKILLGFDPDEEDKVLDAKLNWILASTKSRLKLLLGGIDPPDDMNHIITEVSIVRFNRIGSEGLSSHDVAGESLSFGENDFDGFTNEIQAFLNQEGNGNKGGIRWL